ncbi:MAG: hypothetical protein P8179_09960 [Candidatus Thiodiazotropha sp.]|jgi:hypothetical protein
MHNRFVLKSLTLLLVISRFAVASTLEQDIVSVESTTSPAWEGQMPGLTTGQRINDVLHNALKLVREDALESVHLDLYELVQDLQRILDGESLDSPLPASYQKDGELWLPVKIEQLKVRLDAPDLRPRPLQGEAGGKVGNMSTQARRITWLPVARTVQLLKQILPLRGINGRLREQHQLEKILLGLHTRLELQDRPLIYAYYQVEAALASAPHWNNELRRQLRRAAERLSKEKRLINYANRLQAQSDRLIFDFHGLQQLALDFHRQIETDSKTILEGERATP